MRFDLSAPLGTCYLAERAIGSFLEVFRAGATVPEEEVLARAHARLRVPDQVRLADTTATQARRYGITLELGASPDYQLTHSWARRLRQEGFDGIFYRLRHDPAARLNGVALFGSAGEATWPFESGPIGKTIVDRARDAYGIEVVPTRL